VVTRGRQAVMMTNAGVMLGRFWIYQWWCLRQEEASLILHTPPPLPIMKTWRGEGGRLRRSRMGRLSVAMEAISASKA